MGMHAAPWVLAFTMLAAAVSFAGAQSRAGQVCIAPSAQHGSASHTDRKSNGSGNVSLNITCSLPASGPAAPTDQPSRDPVRGADCVSASSGTGATSSNDCNAPKVARAGTTTADGSHAAQAERASGTGANNLGGGCFAGAGKDCGQNGAKDETRPPPWLPVIAVSTGLLGRAIATLAVAIATVLFARAAVAMFTSLPADDSAPIGFRRHWGGFGGSSTGWYISPALIRLLIAGALAVFAVLMAFALLDAAFDLKKDAASVPEKPASAAEATPAAHK
jgi:hypothetical protein